MDPCVRRRKNFLCEVYKRIEGGRGLSRRVAEDLYVYDSALVCMCGLLHTFDSLLLMRASLLLSLHPPSLNEWKVYAGQTCWRLAGRGELEEEEEEVAA